MYYSNGNYGNQEPKFAITDTKFYVPVVTLSAQDNEKLQLYQTAKIATIENRF